jgi:hypothetical protein
MPVNTSISDALPDNILNLLSPEQRHRVYEEEKSRLKKSSPLISGRTWFLIATYVVGCALLYFGISSAMLDFVATREWALKPEPNLHHDLTNAAIELVRPLLASWMCVLTIAIPTLLAFGVVERSWATTKWVARMLGIRKE